MPKCSNFKNSVFLSTFFLASLPVKLFAGEENVLLPPFDRTVNLALYFVLLSAILGLAYGLYLAFKVIKKEQGTPKMIEVAKAIQEGAKAYLTRQFRVMFFFIILLTIILFFVYKNIYLLPAGSTDWKLVWGIALSFLAASTLSA